MTPGGNWRGSCPSRNNWCWRGRGNASWRPGSCHHGVAANEAVVAEAGPDGGFELGARFGGHDVDEAARLVVAIQEPDRALEQLNLLHVVQRGDAELIVRTAGDAVVAGLLLAEAAGADAAVGEFRDGAHERVEVGDVHRAHVLDQLPRQHLDVLRRVDQRGVRLGSCDGGGALVGGVLTIGDHEGIELEDFVVFGFLRGAFGGGNGGGKDRGHHDGVGDLHMQCVRG